MISKLDARGITFFDPLRTVSNQSVTFTVVSKEQVSKFSGLFNLILKFKWIIPVIALVLAILSVALAMERRKALVRLGVGVALMSLLVLGALSAGRGIFIGQAAGGGFNAQGAAAVWDTVLRFLKTDLRWTLVISVLVAFAGWLAGPARYAVWIRKTCASGGRWVAAQYRALTSGAGRAAAESSRVRRTGGWIVEHLSGLRIVGVVVAALILVFGGNLTGWSLLVIVLVLAVYLGLLQLVAAWARKVALAGGEPVAMTPGSGDDPAPPPRCPQARRRGDPTRRGPWSLFGAAAGAHTGDMAEITAILVAGALLVAGVEAWYETWRRRMAASGGSRVRSTRAVVQREPDSPGTPRDLSHPDDSGVPSRGVLMVGLFGTRNVSGMSIRWRIGLVAVIAAAVVGGFLPHGVLSVTDTSATQVVRALEAPLSGSVNCADATCGKGNTAPAAPSPGLALVAVVAGVLGVVAAGRLRPAPAWTPSGASCRSTRPAVSPAAVLLARPEPLGRCGRCRDAASDHPMRGV